MSENVKEIVIVKFDLQHVFVILRYIEWYILDTISYKLLTQESVGVLMLMRP